MRPISYAGSYVKPTACWVILYVFLLSGDFVLKLNFFKKYISGIPSEGQSVLDPDQAQKGLREMKKEISPCYNYMQWELLFLTLALKRKSQ